MYIAHKYTDGHRKWHKYSLMSFYRVNVRVITVCAWERENALFMYKHDFQSPLWFCWSSSSVSVPGIFRFLFLPREALNFAFRGYHYCVLLSNKGNSGTFFVCWDILIANFLPSVFSLLFTYSPFFNHFHSILFCFSISFSSVASEIPSHFL